MAPSSNPTANRLALLAKDAELALEYLEALAATRGRTPEIDPRGILHSALMHAAIVVYARSFKRNQGSSGVADERADLGQLQVSQDSDLMALHSRIIHARDTMIAHSDWDKRRSVVLDKQRVEGGESFSVLRATTMTQGWEGIDERAFRRLAGLVREQAERRAFDLERQS